MTGSVYIYGPAFSTFVRSVIICCEEKGIAYQVGSKPFGERIDFFSDGHARLHPQKLFPVLIEGDFQLYETAAICRYLDAHYPGPRLQPDDPRQRAIVDQRSQAISLYTYEAVVQDFILERVFPKGPDGTVREQRIAERLPRLQLQLRQLTTQLADNRYIAGATFTIADALLFPQLDTLATFAEGRGYIDCHPSLSNYLERLQQRPSTRNLQPNP